MKEKMRVKPTDRLSVSFGIFFAFFTLIVPLVAGFLAYTHNTSAYLSRYDKTLSDISAMLAEETRTAFTPDIKSFFISRTADISAAAGRYSPGEAKQAFEAGFAAQYPGKAYGHGIGFAELTDELKILCAVSLRDRLIERSEQIKRLFSLEYAAYIFDCDPETLFVSETVSPAEDGAAPAPLLRYRVASGTAAALIAEAREKGKATTEAEYSGSRLLACIVTADGDRTRGMICTAADIGSSQREAFFNSFIFALILAVTIAILSIVAMTHIRKFYIDRICQLSESIGEYTRDKDPAVAVKIRENSKGSDDISVLSVQTASMITELQSHIDRLMAVSGELLSANDRAEKLSKLARRDALTGLENKLAYNEAVARLDEAISSGETEFAMIVIDLNYLKRINDEYGHIQGDAMIKKLADRISGFFRGCGAYRIGGDEFAVIIEGEASSSVMTLAANFRRLLGSEGTADYWISPSAAVGCSGFRAGSDKCVMDVFRRADNEMYGNKKQMKALRGD